MGFVPQHKTYDLDFKGTEYEGLEIRVRDMSSGELIDMPDSAAHEALVNAFAGQLDSWNIETKDGQPVKPVLENVLKLDRSMNVAIIAKWLDALNGVPSGPLPSSSPDGEPSPEVSIPMAPLS